MCFKFYFRWFVPMVMTKVHTGNDLGAKTSAELEIMNKFQHVMTHNFQKHATGPTWYCSLKDWLMMCIYSTFLSLITSWYYTQFVLLLMMCVLLLTLCRHFPPNHRRRTQHANKTQTIAHSGFHCSFTYSTCSPLLKHAGWLYCTTVCLIGQQ